MNLKKQLYPNKAVQDLIEKKFCPYYNKVIYIVYGLSILFNILIIVSLVNVEKINCDCANIPDKRFLKEWFIFNLIFNVLIITFFILSNNACYVYIFDNTFVYLLTSVVYLITFIMLVRLLVYLNIMRKKCECGYGNLQAFLFWYFIIIFSIGALFLLLALILAIFGLIKFSS